MHYIILYIVPGVHDLIAIIYYYTIDTQGHSLYRDSMNN